MGRSERKKNRREEEEECEEINNGTAALAARFLPSNRASQPIPLYH